MGGGPINLPELVCESLRDSLSQAAVRGHLHPACTEELLSGVSTNHHHHPTTSCFCPSTENSNKDPRFRQQSPVISTYGRCMCCSALCKTRGQICRGAYVTQTSQTPGGDERRGRLIFHSHYYRLFPR